MSDTEILKRMKRYRFYHTIQLTDEIWTEGWPAIRSLSDMTLRNLRMLDIRGKRVLDIGCRDGLFCYEAEKLGAAKILGIDNDPSIAAQDFLIPFLRSKVQMHELNLYELKPDTFGTFDLVIFAGVLYHLRYPFWALKLVRDVLNPGGLILLETAVIADDNRLPLLFCPIGEESPYEDTSCTFFNLKALQDTLSSLGLTTRRVERLLNLGPPAKERPRLWERVAAVLKPPPLPPPEPPIIDRALLVCEKNPATVNARLASYWDGHHRMHSQYTLVEDSRDLRARSAPPPK
jgi:SAM-dependent methyltransferase